MNFRRALVAATILAMPIAANAQPVRGLYVGAGAGIDIPLSQDVNNLTLFNGGLGGVGTGTQMKFGVGFAGDASIGWGFGNGLRLELEGKYLNTRGKGLTGAGANGGGTQQKYGPMVNALWDFNGISPMFVPYVGVGVGALFVNDNLHAYNTGALAGGTPGAFNVQTNATNGVFAYQAILGFAVPIASVPGLAVTADYRFVGTAGNRSDNALYTSGFGATAVSVPGKVQMGPSYDNTIMVGVRYNFGVAPPPAPAPVAPAPAPMSKSYLVFFDWDKATLTDRARQIIAEAASNSKKVQYTKIEVNGYTDTSGSPQYNMGLSIRRAQAVAAELVKNGVPKAAIAIQGFGETNLLVPTGPNVREPQNRRVEIIIR